MNLTTGDRDRFMSKTERGAGCWMWRGSRNALGYGTFQLRAVSALAHRVAYALAHGDVPDGKVVMHTCDVPGCVNPDHLVLGTQAQNMADCKAKGRIARGDRNGLRANPDRAARGEAHYRAKLTEAAVRSMRERHAAGESCASLATAYGVGPVAVSKAVRSVTWRRVR